ncbi:hypothetical protein NO559_12340 [Dasania sp. GY-MA-18]|uniref:DUF5020 domain-containing protein n=1 Tax=Dasania phycosphaerae TaxID=2950436 RepID=A0A9J6RPF3_9GAMM|nr:MULTISPECIES: hypothetical protein [Dasania]MCR8923565.1 hypothetical protein [Dasania sp. GY-MA-18]MCZ0865999.1 hypothetical protein [Dasania phycosphaerae]MCZ0869723.1 hypothetical protein [Dasania phycosphaerae]
MKNIVSILVAVIAAAYTPLGYSKQLWSDFSISYLQGNDYLNPFADYEYSSKVVTLEHASGHTWGGTFMFMDRLTSDDGSADETYGEIGATMSMPKLMGKQRKDSFIKDYYLTAQLEHQSKDRGFNNYLYGLGVSLTVPAAKYFNVIVYRRNQDDFGIGKEDNNQLTITWCFDFAENWRIDGFWDITDSYDTIFGEAKGESHFTPQIKYNLGPAMGMDTGRFDVGIEYTYWKNKFGVDGADQKSVDMLIKWHF